VTAADVDKAVSAATGNRNRAYVATLIKKTINHAKRARLLPDSHRSPAADVSIKKPPKNGRALETDDIARFGAALAAMEREGKGRFRPGWRTCCAYRSSVAFGRAKCERSSGRASISRVAR
jgi:hypothetical protein